MTGDYAMLRFTLLVASAVIALSNGVFVKHDHARYLSLAFGLFVVARIIKQYL